MRLLVTGGAGYVGAHAARYLERVGHDVWVLDDLSTGHLQAVNSRQFVHGDLRNRDLLRTVLRQNDIEGVVHFAGSTLVGESVADPSSYYSNNVGGTISLLESMRETGVWRIVFSSTTATYGAPNVQEVCESHAQHPINPYGFTKLVVERMLRDYARAYGFGYVAFRFFNAAGASPDGDIGEDHHPESHLIPLVLQVAMGQRESISIFGNDYRTADGTCVRDYVHVDDLASAHELAIRRLKAGTGQALNLGMGKGHSVMEVIDACRSVTGHPIPAQIGARRAGDPPRLVADTIRARSTLGWQPTYTRLEDIIATAWRWHRSHPSGYGSHSRHRIDSLRKLEPKVTYLRYAGG